VTLPAWTSKPAHFSDPQHRVWLKRTIDMFPSFPVGFILHNPSIASHDLEDPTSRKTNEFARRWGASEKVMVNAVTGIATDARDLASMADPIGPLADEAIVAAAEYCLDKGGFLIACWGRPKGNSWTMLIMEQRFKRILSLGLPLRYLRLTDSRYPEHPLYVPYSTPATPWQYEAPT
jgi:hypothetical protein